MLVQMDFDTLKDMSDRLEGYAFCENCGLNCGKMAVEEMQEMLTKTNVSFLCDSCKSIAPPNYHEYSEGHEKRIKDVLGLTEREVIPPNSWSLWVDDTHGLLVYWKPETGWRIWALDITTGKWELAAVRWAAHQVSYLVDRYDFLPCRVK